MSVLSRKRRVAVWSPLPPVPSGISDSTCELLHYLGEACSIEVFIDEDYATSVGVEGRFTVYPSSMFPTRHAESPFDVNVYHMGNNANFHSKTYKQLLHYPGITVLHDVSLFDFYRGLYYRQGRDSAFLDEVEFHHGPETRLSVRDMIAGKLPIDRLAITLSRRIVEGSLAIVTYNEWGRALLARRYPHKHVVHIPQGVPILDDDVDSPLRQRLKWGKDDLVIGVFGGLSPMKRVHTALSAFEQVHNRFPHTRLLLAGRADDVPYAREIQRATRNARLRNALYFADELAPSDFERAIRAADLIVNLRWPTAGETSAILRRAFGAGKVVITSDIPQVAEYDEDFCWKIPTQEGAEERELVARLSQAAMNINAVRGSGQRARHFMRETASWDAIVQQHLAVIESALAIAPQPITTNPHEGESQVTGVNLVGDLTVASGLGEATVSMLTAMTRSGIPVSYWELPYPYEKRAVGVRPSVVTTLPEGNPHPINLLAYNINAMFAIPEEQMQRATAGKHTIAHWFWEMAKVPEHWLPEFQRVDEVWVASRFTQTTMLHATQIPITLIPVPVEVVTSPTVERGRFGIPEDRFVFYNSFSAASCSGRKNPWALIDAFQRAFGTSVHGGPLLVIKVHHLEIFPDLHAALKDAMKRVGGLLITDSYSRQQTNDLLACADAYVSLHRSEGFGLGMAESMYLGKPVIGTQYSGNVDFMTPENSFPVDYTLRSVNDDDHRYQPQCAKVYIPGDIWAEPDVEQAAFYMHHVYNQPEAARSKGRRAANDIRQYCCPEVVGSMIRDRLESIASAMRERQLT